MNEKKFAGLTGLAIKNIAAVAMVLDHIAIGFVDDLTLLGMILHFVGSITIPVSCYMLVEGYHNTSNRRLYGLRLLNFAALSYLPYVLYMQHGWYRMNFIFDLFLAYLAVVIIEYEAMHKALRAVIIFALMVISVFFSGWPLVPIIYVLVLNSFYGNKKKQLISLTVMILILTASEVGITVSPLGWLGVMGLPWWFKMSQLGSLLAVGILSFYNGKRCINPSSEASKNFFYFFYPVHILALFLIKTFAVEKTGIDAITSQVIFSLLSVVVIVGALILFIHCAALPSSRAQMLFAIALMGLVVFASGLMIEVYMSDSLKGAEVAVMVQYLGQAIALCPILIFACEIVGFTIPRTASHFLIAGECLVMAGVFTIPYNTLFYKEHFIVTDGLFSMLEIVPGPLYYLHYVYFVAVFVTIAVVCVYEMKQGTALRKKGAWSILLAILVLAVELILKALGVFGNLNPVSIALYIMTLIFYMAFFRDGYFDNVQVAIQSAIDQGGEGLIVFDDIKKVAMINPVANIIFPEVKKGMRVTPDNPLNVYMRKYEECMHIRVDDGRVFEVRFEELLNGRGIIQGYMLWMLDVTEHSRQLDIKHLEVMQKDTKLSLMQQDVIMAVVNIIESRDGTTGGHIKRTSKYVDLLVELLKKSGLYPELSVAEYTENIVNAAPLHDIGKIAVSDLILSKPGKLTDDEYKEMKTHSAKGGSLIKTNLAGIENENFVRTAANIAKYHHERYDGNGYPKGLAGEDIPLEARIMAVADVFDALTSERSYKPMFTLEESKSEIEKNKGTQFDPQITEVFLDNFEMFERLHATLMMLEE